MSRYPARIVRQSDGVAFELFVGTDHASFRLGQRPHYFAQLYGAGVDVDTGETGDHVVLWSADALTFDELEAALEGNGHVSLADAAATHGGRPSSSWLTQTARRVFDAEIAAMNEGGS